MNRNQRMRRLGTRWRGAASGLAVLFSLAAFAGKPLQARQLKPAQDRTAQTTDVSYTEDVRSDGEAVTVMLNGWPIADTDGGQDAGLINDAVIDGTNHLSVTVAPPPNHKKIGSVDAASVLIQKDAATTLRVPTSVFSFQWRANAQPSQPLPLHKEITFQSATHFGPRAWQSAPKITLDAATKAAIRAQAHRFRDMLNAKNPNSMAKMFAVRDHEDAVSHGEVLKQSMAEAHGEYKKMLSRSSWRMEPVHDAQMQFHLLAGSRVVLVDYGRDNGVLETVPDQHGDINGFSMYLSFLNGQWTIVQ